MAATPEAKAKKGVRNLLKGYQDKGANLWYFMPPANGYGAFGIPDIVGCYNGLFFAIEVKSASGKTTPLQDHVIDSITEAKGKTFVVYGEDLAELGNWLDTGYEWKV